MYQFVLPLLAFLYLKSPVDHPGQGACLIHLCNCIIEQIVWK